MDGQVPHTFARDSVATSVKRCASEYGRGCPFGGLEMNHVAWSMGRTSCWRRPSAVVGSSSRQSADPDRGGEIGEYLSLSRVLQVSSTHTMERKGEGRFARFRSSSRYR